VSAAQALKLGARLRELRQGEAKEAVKLRTRRSDLQKGEAKMAVEQLPCRFSWWRSDYATTGY
jgi:hypothetical protein